MSPTLLLCCSKCGSDLVGGGCLRAGTCNSDRGRVHGELENVAPVVLIKG